MRGLALRQGKDAEHPRLLYFPSTCAHSHLDQIWFSGKFLCYFSVCISFILMTPWLIPCSSVALSGLLMPISIGLRRLCPWTLMSLSHFHPLPLSLSLGDFLGLCIRNRCSLSAPFHGQIPTPGLCPALPVSLAVANLTHFWYLGGKGVYLSMRLLNGIQFIFPFTEAKYGLF